MTTIKLDYPISTNRMWRTYRNMTVLSAEGKNWKQVAAWNAVSQGCKLLSGDLLIELVLCPRLTKKNAASAVCVDLDNALKVALDSLQGVAYSNDKQIKKIIAQYGEPVLNGGLIITISQIGESYAAHREGAFENNRPCKYA